VAEWQDDTGTSRHYWKAAELPELVGRPLMRSNFSLLESGIFTVSEAALLVAEKQSLVRVWIEGHTRKQKPVIDNELGRVDGKTAVSFTNLMELRFVAFFAPHVGLREIRKIMDEAKETLGHPHPFATRTVFKTDGKKIVAEIAYRTGKVDIYDLRSRNLEMHTIVWDSLKNDVTYDPFGQAISWRPRPQIAPNVIVHPHFSFGQPVLKKSRIPTKALAKAVQVEGSIKFVADIFEIPIKSVREAVKFEQNLRLAA
jgi:uncharacterized protein (DUF433 family)